MRQNKLSFVADDLELYGIPRSVTLRILLARGVFKWLAARRDIIKAKDRWRERITETLGAIRQAKSERDRERLLWLRGYLKALEECRGEMRAICHSDRWRCPDNDTRARRWFEEQAS